MDIDPNMYTHVYLRYTPAAAAQAAWIARAHNGKWCYYARPPKLPNLSSNPGGGGGGVVLAQYGERGCAAEMGDFFTKKSLNMPPTFVILL